MPATMVFLGWTVPTLVGQSGGGHHIKKFTIDGGGGKATGGGFVLNGTVGQHDAGDPTGGGFALSGGFWGPVVANALPPPTTGDNTCQTSAMDTGIPCSTDADCTEPAECGLKSRYISITPANLATPASIRVRVLTAPQFPGIVGHVFYAGPEQSIPNSPNPALRGAPVVCTATPHSQVWTTGVLHLFGASIVPSPHNGGVTTYAVAHCDANGDNCSTELIVETAKWGDVVRQFTAAQPNFADINSIVQKFGNLASAPSIPRVDLVGSGAQSTPNQVANFADISADVDAFRGFPYPYAVTACP